MMYHLDYWQFSCLILIPATLYAAWMDYRAHKVPNWLNAAIALAGFCAQGCFFGWEGLGTAALGMLTGLGLLIVPWLMYAMGAGDVKLMAAIGVWLGPWLTLVAFCLGAILAGAVAVAMILVGGRFWQAWVNLQAILYKMKSRETAFSDFACAKSFTATSQLLPYGVPLTVGSLVVLLGRSLSWWSI